MSVAALADLCPACLFAQGAETERVETKDRVRFEPPKLEEISRLFPQLKVKTFPWRWNATASGKSSFKGRWL